MQRSAATRDQAARYGPPTLVALVVFVCFLPILRCDFVNLDDTFTFGDNPHFRGLSLQHLRWMFTTFYMGHYQPLSWVTHGAVYLVWGMDPRGYHLVNLLLHAANAVLFYSLTRSLLEQACPSAVSSETLALSVAAAVSALVFAIHPLRVEPVAWVTERREVLSSFFLLLTVLAYVRKRREERPGGRGQRKWLLASLGCYVLSLLSKATGMTLPVVLLVLDIYPLHRFTRMDGRVRLRLHTAVLVEKLPYVTLAAAAAIAALFGQRQEAALSLADHNLTARTVQAAYGLCFYLWKTLLPIRLLPLYPLVRPLDPMQPQFVVSVLAVAMITAGLIRWRRRYPWALAAWCCYAVIVSPVLGLVQAGPQIAADRYTYVACMPWAVLAAALIYRLWTDAAQHRVAWPTAGVAGAATVMVLAFLGVRTVQQTRIWKDSFALWDHVLQIEPTALAYNNRGYERYVKGDLAGALADIDNALRLDPQYIAAHYYRGKVRQAQGDVDGALAAFNAALRLKPDLGEAYAGRASARQATGDADGALADFDQALRLAPQDAEAAIKRGNLRQTRGDAQGALADFTHVIAIDPGRVEAYYDRGNLRKQMGDLDGALADYNETLRLNPQYASAYNNRGNLRTKMGDLTGALADYTAVIRLNPQHANAYNSRGNLRRNRGDLQGALADYTQAVGLTPPDAAQRATFERNLATTRQQLAARQQEQ